MLGEDAQEIMSQKKSLVKRKVHKRNNANYDFLSRDYQDITTTNEP